MRCLASLRYLGLCALSVSGPQAAEIPPKAVAPYTADTHPKIALKWGVEALPQINALRAAAARKASASRECDRVSAAELLDLRSESPALWTVAVACANGTTFELRQSDLPYR